MSNLVDRQAAIDAVEESRRLNHHIDGKEACAHEYEHRHFLKILMELPSAQPEIIRCKDCRYYNAEERLCNDLMGFGRYWNENDFCSFAERRTENADINT